MADERADRSVYNINKAGNCSFCDTKAQETTNNPSGVSRLACPESFPKAFANPSSGKTRQGLTIMAEREVRRREAAGTCQNCGVLTTNGECDTHGRNTSRPATPKFDVSEDYASRGTLGPKSTLEDYKHMAWWKGGNAHFQSDSCPTGQCTPDTADHKDRLVLHWDARTTNQKNPRHREYQERPQMRTHRSPGIFRSTTDANGNTVRMNEQS